jgi:hypothetical protein
LKFGGWQFYSGRMQKAFVTNPILVILISLWGFSGSYNSRGAEGANPFLRAGIPAADREWRGSDYAAAAKAFGEAKTPLPRLSEREGRRLLERLLSVENFAFSHNKSLPFAPRMEDYLQLQEGANNILKLYVNQAAKGEVLHKELIRMVAFGLRVAALGVEMTDEFLPTIPKDNKYEIRMDGFRKMRSGMTTMFVGAETSLSEGKIYSQDDLSIMLEAMASTLPTLKSAFTADYRVELSQKLEAHKRDFKQKEDLKRIEQMLTELKK